MTPTVRLAVFAACVAAGVGARPAAAQYFGQNNVQYRHLDFAVIQTKHFDVYYYQGERAAALDAARMAERSYARLSRILNHQYRERQPIVLFASHSEFQQNNITPIDDATGGVTDALRHRIMLPFTGANTDFEHVLQHEMVHQFQYDVFARGRIGAAIPRLMAVQPPGWFMEGMAEYLSSGPVTPQTAMWLRNAALEGHLPTIEQMTKDPRVFPYRYGHALMSYIGQRWGDEVIGEILEAVSTSGMEAGFRRALGLSLQQLSEQWRDAVRRRYLPEIADRKEAHEFARLAVNERRSKGKMHLSPALSPDGRRVAYFSEGNQYWVDLYVADARTGRVLSRLVKSAFSTSMENLRFITSSGSWSPDGRSFAIAAKHGNRDDLVIFDMQRYAVKRRIRLPLDGATTPAWSPDGTRLVFAGYEGGRSNLYVINTDGSGLTPLTHDSYTALQPVWSPDGKTIAFVTDRGPGTDLADLRFRPLGLALYRLADSTITILGSMSGRNIDPQWAPDGRSLAFVSDRTGTPNVFLYDLGDDQSYQLTNVYTGIAGLSDISPAISWASQADELAFAYYEGPDFTFDIYTVNNPRGLKHAPWHAKDTTRPMVAAVSAPADTAAAADPLPGNGPGARSASVYRMGGDFRASASMPGRPSSREQPVSVKALLDSAELALPDTGTFRFHRYSAKLTPDYIAEPSVGYVRDNYGSGVFGGTAISLSDILGNRHLLLAGQVNGRIDEAQILTAYTNLSHRLNWTVGFQQYPIFFYSGSSLTTDTSGTPVATLSLDRYVVRQAFLQTALPFNRFRRIEFGLSATDIGRARQDYVQYLDPSGYVYDASVQTTGLGHSNYIQPTIALVFDNSVSLYVGPYLGRRSRFEYSPAWGDWRFHQFLADYRRYDHLVGPFILATRELFVGRFGRDDNQFPIFLGTPDLLRGYTAGSLRRHECLHDVAGSYTGCAALDQLVGSRVAVFNAELRFPLVNGLGLGVLPVWFPPIEGALFFDAGMAWRGGSDIVMHRRAGDNPDLVRQPLSSWGGSARINLLGLAILRFDYAKPLSRAGIRPYWTVSLGPTF